MIKAPWTMAQVRTLNARQRESSLHPYACGKCGANLRAVVSGLLCLRCGSIQDWAHSMDVDGSWRRLVASRKGLDAEIDNYINDK